MKVAIVGVQGIGRHHAKWWQMEGACPCAFVGSTDQSVAQAKKMLDQHLNQEIPGFSDVSSMLRQVRPEIVDICSPPALHAHHCEIALEAGCHVLCEKPFLYQDSVPSSQLLQRADSIVRLAQRRNRRLGFCFQYVESIRFLGQLWDEIRQGERIFRMEGILGSPAKGRSSDPARVWVDLAPHPLSAIQTFYSEYQPDWESLSLRFEGYHADAEFDLLNQGKVLCQCKIRTFNTEIPPSNVRRFLFNDIQFDIEGFRDDKGIFQARVVWDGGVRDTSDFMREVIRRFLNGEISASGQMACQNMEWMLKILERPF